MATIQASSGRISGSPNDLGLFPRVLTEIGETVEISATFPDAEPGDLIFVQAEDGGALDGGPPVARLYLDENRSLHFAFRGTAEGGLSRVTLRKDLDEKHLEFWAGPEPTGPTTP